jgi:Fur family peroxide stress response transcriptional regulator
MQGSDDNLSHMVISRNRDSTAAPIRRRPARTAGEVDWWCDRFEKECRRRGMRMTPQRLAVYRTLAEDTTHPTADAVLAKLRAGMKGLSRATVYRILESLEREGFVNRVSTTDGVGRYEANLAPHQHLVCRRCGQIADMELAALRHLRLPRRGPAGCVLEALDIRVVGTCERCRRPDGMQPKLKQHFI